MESKGTRKEKENNFSPAGSPESLFYKSISEAYHLNKPKTENSPIIKEATVK